MNRTSHLTRAQKRLLAEFFDAPLPINWPSLAILRRWMQQPAFREALNEVSQGIRLQADLQFACSSAATAAQLDRCLSSGDGAGPRFASARDQIEQLTNILHLQHLRQRFHQPVDDA